MKGSEKMVWILVTGPCVQALDQSLDLAVALTEESQVRRVDVVRQGDDYALLVAVAGSAAEVAAIEDLLASRCGRDNFVTYEYIATRVDKPWP